VGDQPVVTVTHPISNLDPNQIDSINVDVRALVSQGYVGTLIATVAVPETGTDTGVFSGGLNTITLDNLTDDATGLDHTLIKVIFSSGVVQAALVAPPEPEPEEEVQEEEVQEPEPVYGSSGLYCPPSSGGYTIVDWSPSESITNYWITFSCGYEGYDSNDNLRYVGPVSVEIQTQGSYDDQSHSLACGEVQDLSTIHQFGDSTYAIIVSYSKDLPASETDRHALKNAALDLLSQTKQLGLAIECESSEPVTPTDSDSDGIADDNDDCPNEYGPSWNNGCPEPVTPTDSDSDGVTDDNDDCPNEYGTIHGCPDIDGDTVPDSDDDCPNEYGPSGNNGCPEPVDEEPVVKELVEEEPVVKELVEEEPEQEVTEVVASWETMDGKKIWVDGQWKVADEKGFGVLSEKSNKVSGFAFDKKTSFALGFLGKENCGQLVMKAVESKEFLGADPWELCYKKKLWWESITAPPDPQCGTDGKCSESKQWEFYGKTAKFLYDGIAAARSPIIPTTSEELEKFVKDFQKDLSKRDPKNNFIASYFDSLTDQIPIIAFLKSGGVYLVHDLPNYMMSDLYAEKIGAGSVSITGGTNFFPAKPTPEIIAVDGGPYLFVKGTELSVRVENGVTTLMVFDGSVLALNPVSPYNVEIIEANEYLIASSQKFEKGTIEPSSIDRWWDAVLIPDDKEPARETMVSEMQEKSDNGGRSLDDYASIGLGLFILFGIPAIIIGLVIWKIKQRRRKKQIKIQS